MRTIPLSESSICLIHQYSHSSNPVVYWCVISPAAVGTLTVVRENTLKLNCVSVRSGDDITSIQQEITMMKECKHKNIVAYFGSYHRCRASSARPPHMCGIPGIVGGLNYEEFDFHFPHKAAGIPLPLVLVLTQQRVNDAVCICGH